ncbi:hypothetical protein [Candidatus Similichlamydia laticola]|uniref:Uncharacterized protein n=1 Tax=Candidatus Similichlamydia laticola TaxID=2170265 RepID=A0A369KI19_9BACT|nr:hypothetical protein [Candidatus Similichlamydia laticola]RDB31414.1 hypothetical protein HAT2_00481 [Candidatus Similichlamydia laticola]
MGGLIKYTEDDYESSLTNEQLSRRFRSRFDLVLYAIEETRKAIVSGRGKTVVGNLPFEVLKELAEKPEEEVTSVAHRPRLKVRKMTTTEKRIASSSSRRRNWMEESLPNHS